MSEMFRRFCFRNQNSPYFAHARAVKKKGLERGWKQRLGLGMGVQDV